jgi:hypothetical protein
MGRLNYDALSNYKIGGAGGGGLKEWFRPKPTEDGGDNRFNIRLLLGPNDEFPFFDTSIHYFRTAEGFKSGACPRVNDDYCPACDMFFKLRLIPEISENKENMKKLRNVSPTTRVYANIINDDSDKVQIWSMPYTAATELRNILLTYLEDGIDLTDPKEGRNVVFVVGKKGAVTQYKSFSARPLPTEVTIEDWEAQCHDLKAKAHGTVFTTEEVTSNMRGVLGDSFELFAI